MIFGVQPGIRLKMSYSHLKFRLKEIEMKTILAGAVALSLLAGTAAVAAPHGYDNRNDARYQDHRDDRHENRQGVQHRDNRHHWRQGERLPSSYRTRAHYVDYRKHHLRQPPRGYQWVQADNNYVMVALTTGLIASIIGHN